MAYSHHASAFFLVALGLLAAAYPLAHAVTVNASVSGNLCCRPTGNCPGRGVSGANVNLNCFNSSGNPAPVAGTITNEEGRFNIEANVEVAVLNDTSNLQLPCLATVRLPLNRTVCPVLSTVNGTLVGVVQTVDVDEDIPAVNATVPLFIRVGN